MVYKNILQVLLQLNSDLNAIITHAVTSIYNKVQTFVIDLYCLENVELHLFSAFKAPKDDIFYLDQDSETWTKLREKMVDVRAEGDLQKYKDQLKN